MHRLSFCLLGLIVGGILLAVVGSIEAQYNPPPNQNKSPSPNPNPPTPTGNITSTSGGYGNPAQTQPPLPEVKAYIRVFLPNDKAKITIDGNPTSATGPSRLFETPPLPVGKNYTYTVKATWIELGKPVTHERRVTVTPGLYAVANFWAPVHADQIAAPQDQRTPQGY